MPRSTSMYISAIARSSFILPMRISATSMPSAVPSATVTSDIHSVPYRPEMNTTRVGAPKNGSESLIALVNECIDELTAKDQLQTWFDEYEAYAATLGIE